MSNSKFHCRFSPSNLRSSGACSWLVFVLLVCGSSSPPSAGAAQLTFDDLVGEVDRIPNGYGGLQWSNFYFLNPVRLANPSGYFAGMVSQPNVAFNVLAEPAWLFSANPFELNSGYFTGAWNDGLQLEVRGYIGLNLVYDNAYTLSATAPSFIDFSYVGVTSVNFISSGGTHHPGYDGSGTHFAMDDLTVTVVPEPSAIALLLVGLACQARATGGRRLETCRERFVEGP